MNGHTRRGNVTFILLAVSVMGSWTISAEARLRPLKTQTDFQSSGGLSHIRPVLAYGDYQSTYTNPGGQSYSGTKEHTVYMFYTGYVNNPAADPAYVWFQFNFAGNEAVVSWESTPRFKALVPPAAVADSLGRIYVIAARTDGSLAVTQGLRSGASVSWNTPWNTITSDCSFPTAALNGTQIQLVCLTASRALKYYTYNGAS